MIDPGTIIDGRYRVISKLGSGGMADVYLAQDQLLGREVAVKLLHHHYAEDQEFVERFRREASSAAALSHPNIVAIFDRGEWDGTYYIAMEYVQGRTLKAIVREHGALEPTLAIDIVLQILQAARFAHRRGVIHRDLKPHNVIIDEEGRARVTDFGIARAGASDMTLTGSIMGTAQYLSPEQAQGYAVSSVSDLYSVGVILYELLTGVVPFEGETAVAVAFKQVSAAPRPPSQLNQALPVSLDAVVLRALAKDPADRYGDADELTRALQRERALLPEMAGATAMTSVHGAPPVSAPPPAPPRRPGPMLVPAAAGDEEPAGEGPRGGRALLWVLGLAVLAGLIVAAVLLINTRSSVKVPIVLGQNEALATSTIRAAGLTPNPTSVASSSVPRGDVVSQSPVGGSSVSKGTRVSFAVSQGPSTLAIPSVSGQSSEMAIATLQRDGFVPSAKAQPSTTVTSGKVIATEPAAGLITQTGTKVTVLVSSGPAPVKVPDVTGQTLAAAEATLANAGLTVGKITQKESSEPAGTVLAQSPSRGNSVAASSAVALTVSKASNTVLVPNLIGKTAIAASAELGEAGLKPEESKVETTEQSKEGIVVTQSPAPSSKVTKGSKVTIGVGTIQTATTPTTTTPTTSTSTSTTPNPAG